MILLAAYIKTVKLKRFMTIAKTLKNIIVCLNKI